MGDTVPDHKNIKLNVLLPGQKSEIKLIGNGKVLETSNGIDAEFIVNKKVFTVLKFLMKIVPGFIQII